MLELPLFPLDLVLLPYESLPLHIFEPRYLAMIEDSMKTPHRLIGMLQPTGNDGRLHSIGCAGKLTQFSETEDGRYMITLTGVSRFSGAAIFIFFDICFLNSSLSHPTRSFHPDCSLKCTFFTTPIFWKEPPFNIIVETGKRPFGR